MFAHAKREAKESRWLGWQLPASSSSPPRLPRDASFSAAQADRLIRSLNLLPKEAGPAGGGDAPSVAPGELLERRIRVPGLPQGVGVLCHHTGYYRPPNTHDARCCRMFYLLIESKGKKEDPVVIWLTGGPGCSSDHCQQHVTCLEQIQRGHSVLPEASEFAKNDFFITGESYAGLYIPAFASRIHQRNKANEGIHINLKGFAIGNGRTDPAIQYKAYTDYALEMNLIEKSDYERINKFIPPCEFAIKLCGTNGKASCMAWQHTWSAILFSAPIMKRVGTKNHYSLSSNANILDEKFGSWHPNTT
ncbi:hypothetical protein ABZP36_020508 [Zizania latifolia]